MCVCVCFCVCLIDKRIAYTNGRRERRSTGNRVRAVQQYSGRVGACVLVYCRRAAGHTRGGAAAALKAPRKEKSVINYLRVVYRTGAFPRLRPYAYNIVSSLHQRVVIIIHIYTLYISQRRRFRLYYII